MGLFNNIRNGKYKLYIWVLKLLGMSTKIQHYKRLIGECNRDFEFLRKYLLKEDRQDGYLTLENKEKEIGVDNFFEFKIGSRRILISYYIDINKFERIYKTQEIEKNKEDYGKFRLRDIENLKLFSVVSEEYLIDNNSNHIYFPNGYLEMIEKEFTEI